MAEPLKNSFGPEVPIRIADRVASVWAGFEREAFLAAVNDGFDEMELTPRARHVADALAVALPADRERAIEILVDSMGPEDADRTGMESFIYFPYGFFIADYGLDCFETSMRAQYELTKRFTAEFSIRAFLERYPDQTLARLLLWTQDPNVHVRRLVSEGTRPRLPWAPRLRGFQADPTPVIELLELLKDDPEEYVRRSVANNLNDISKDHPDVVVEVAQRWSDGASKKRKRLVRHGLRTLIKQGHVGALAILGYGADSPAVIGTLSCEPRSAQIGDKLRVEVEILNPSEAEIGVLVDLRVHFVKARGDTRPRVFKGAERTIASGGKASVSKVVSLAQHSTRTHYPGVHRVEVMVNGCARAEASFEIV